MLVGIHRSGFQGKGCQDRDHPLANRCNHPSATSPKGYQRDEPAHPDLTMVVYGCTSPVKQRRQWLLWGPITRCPNAITHDSSECCTRPCCPSHCSVNPTKRNIQWHVQQQRLRTSRFHVDERLLRRLLTSWNDDLNIRIERRFNDACLNAESHELIRSKI